VNQELIAPLVVTGISFTIGTWTGYQVRKLVVRVQAWRELRRDSQRQLVETEPDLGFPRVTEIGDDRPMLIPLTRSMVKQSAPPLVSSVDDSRDDVVAALVGAGFKKTAASTAVDACTLQERLAGVEAWTVAALRRAVR